LKVKQLTNQPKDVPAAILGRYEQFYVAICYFPPDGGVWIVSLTSQVRAMERTHNLHQLDKELSFYADDARFEMQGCKTVQGKDELRKIFTVDVLLNNSLAFSDISIVGNTVVCKVEEKNDMWRALGVEKVYERTEIVFKNGLIQEVRATKSAQSESAAELDKADQAFSAWADKNRPEEVARLLGGKPFEGWLTPENALGFLKLAREWKKLERIQ
jgi:hypothetical protein